MKNRTTQCQCGSVKDYRASQCQSCASRVRASNQWSNHRERMVAAMQKSGIERRGKHIKPKEPCSVEACSEPTEARTYCHRHYAYWRLHGIPEPVRLTDEQRFWLNVEKGKNCWLYKYRNDNGYGIITVNGRRERAHRYSYFLHKGEWPILDVLHSCDTPACVRPEHLRQGTPLDNAQDRVLRERQPRGERVGGSKLTMEQVIEIKQELAKGVFQRVLAERFGVHQSTISDISRAKVWNHANENSSS